MSKKEKQDKKKWKALVPESGEDRED